MRPPYDKIEGGGDWLLDGATLVIRGSGDNLDDPETLLVAIHELIEATLCRARGVTQQAVDAFDAAYEGDGEPGDDPASPYRREHRFAMIVEMMLAHELGLDGYGEMR
ncbi:MAG TPA: hypothetical protein VFW56_11920 [Bradyrhizobium sp.]|nr:hypothetical protein [Bradyrhizobium sp.]